MSTEEQQKYIGILQDQQSQLKDKVGQLAQEMPWAFPSSEKQLEALLAK